MKSAARDAFLIIAATAREQYLRWTATINLMELAGDAGVRLQFGVGWMITFPSSSRTRP